MDPVAAVEAPTTMVAVDDQVDLVTHLQLVQHKELMEELVETWEPEAAEVAEPHKLEAAECLLKILMELVVMEAMEQRHL